MEAEWSGGALEPRLGAHPPSHMAVCQAGDPEGGWALSRHKDCRVGEVLSVKSSFTSNQTSVTPSGFQRSCFCREPNPRCIIFCGSGSAECPSFPSATPTLHSEVLVLDFNGITVNGQRGAAIGMVLCLIWGELR